MIKSKQISDVFLALCANTGKITKIQLDEKITESLGIPSEDLKILNLAFESYVKIAVNHIHRTYHGNPKISVEEAEDDLRKCMFFLNDEAFEIFFRWAKWCVAKGG